MSKKTRYGMTAVAIALTIGMTAARAACDFSFTATPTFAPMCIAGVQSGTYTIRNNSPVSLRINYITLRSNDALPAAASELVTAPVTNCGSTLAAGASCNIQVNLLPLSTGQYNRTLLVGVNSRQVQITAPVSASVLNCFPPAPPIGTLPLPPFPATPGEIFPCTILAGSAVTNTGPSVVNGNVCVSPGTAISGFPPGIITNGGPESNTLLAQQAQAAATTAYNSLAAQPCTLDLTGQNLGERTLFPGVYCFATSAQLTGALTLNGLGNPNSVFIFKIGSTLTTATGASVTLINGASKANVFWQVGSSATFGSATQFQGTVIALASITFNSGAQLLGVAIARTAAVTLISNIVNPV